MDPRPAVRTPLWGHALAFLGYLALTLFFLRPAATVLGTHIAPDPGDPLFNMVVLKWGIHEMRTGMHGFWSMPFFFPAHGVTTFSDHLLGPAFFATLFTAVIPNPPNPILAYNLLFLGSFVLCGFNTWFVLRRCGLGAPAAFLGGCLFAFSPFRWDQLSHIQVLLMHWIPVTLWSWDRLLTAPTWRRAAVFFLFYVLHVTGGSYLGYMIHYPLLVLLLFRAPALLKIQRRDPMAPDARRRALRILIPLGLACGLVLAGIYAPYLLASSHQARSPQEIQIFGGSLVSYLTPTGNNLYADLWPEVLKRPENALFPGFFTAVLAFLAAWRGWKRRQTPTVRPLTLGRRITLWTLTALTLLAWLESELRVWALATKIKAPVLEILSAHRLGVFAIAAGLLALLLRRIWGGNWPLRLADLDPWQRGLLVSGILCFLLTFPLLYLPLMRSIPGLSGMRVPARFNAFVSFSLVFFAAGELDRRLRRLQGTRPEWKKLAVGAVGALLLLEVTPRPISWSPQLQEKNFAPVYRWLAAQPNVTALLELPIQDNSTDISYMYFATLHWKPLVNGYSGYIPDHYAELMETCCYPLPNPEQLDHLRNWGVTHVLLHKKELGTKWERRWAWHWLDEPGISLEYEDDTDRVYGIAEPIR
jgi:hypothetical protein